MTLSTLLAECEAQGTRFIASHCGLLQIEGTDEALTPALLARFKIHKGELIEIIERIEERAAIMEYDGGLNRVDAERLARQCESRNP